MNDIPETEKPKARKLAVTPSAEDLHAAEKAALEARIRELQAQVAAAPPAPVKKEPVPEGPPKVDTDLYGPWTAPRRLCGVLIRDPFVSNDKFGRALTLYPGSTYKDLTVGQVRTAMSTWSYWCSLLAAKDEDEGMKHVFLGEVHDNA